MEDEKGDRSLIFNAFFEENPKKRGKKNQNKAPEKLSCS